jgi:RNA polymerase sigma-70 factor (sigma-E family)
VRGGRETSDSHDDAMLSRLYHGVSERQEPHYAAEYDMTAGLKRYQSWLDEHGQDAGPPPAAPDAFLAPETVRTEWSADLAVIELYSVHYRSLVRLAAMLVRDTQTAEEVVQDAFVSMHDGWGRLKDTEKALAYMRQAVVNKSRSVLRHRIVVDKNLQNAPPDMPSAEHGAFVLLERDAVVAALRKLPERQREAIVLRYYAELSEAEIAATMKISRGAVKSHTARGMAALKAALEQELWRPPTGPLRAPPRSGTSSPTSCAWRCTRQWTRSSLRTAWTRSAPGSRPISPEARSYSWPRTSVPPASAPSTSVPPASAPSSSVPPASLPRMSVPPASAPSSSVPPASSPRMSELLPDVITVSFRAGLSNSLYHRGSAFIAHPPESEPGNPARGSTDRSA